MFKVHNPTTSDVKDYVCPSGQRYTIPSWGTIENVSEADAQYLQKIYGWLEVTRMGESASDAFQGSSATVPEGPPPTNDESPRGTGEKLPNKKKGRTKKSV